MRVRVEFFQTIHLLNIFSFQDACLVYTMFVKLEMNNENGTNISHLICKNAIITDAISSLHHAIENAEKNLREEEPDSKAGRNKSDGGH